MLKKILGLMLLMLTLALPALAQEAPVITGACAIRTAGGSANTGKLRDGKRSTYQAIAKGKHISVESKEQDISGLFLQHYDRSVAVEIQALVDGAWQTVAKSSGAYLSEYFPLPEGVRQARIVNAGKARVFLAELTVYGEGDEPANAQQWNAPGKADLMLLVAHPDDELLWFGGLLPTYAGQQNLNVQVAYLVPSIPQRRLELLDGLWHCGVDTYPLFGDMPDNRSNTLKGQYKRWNKNKVLGKVVAMIRQVQPEVLVTHDVNGEYGHGAHRVSADVCRLAMEAAADPKQFPESAEKYGTWQVKKLYLHLYDENPIVMDWHQPLSAFNGKDGIAVANEALQCHKSQVAAGWDAVSDGDAYDSAKLGLAWSTVGEDVEKNDLFENIGE